MQFSRWGSYSELGSRRAGRVSLHDRLSSVSECRATSGLPVTALVVSSTVSLRQKTVLCLKGSSGHYPTLLGVALTPRILHQRWQRGQGSPRNPSVARHRAKRHICQLLARRGPWSSGTRLSSPAMTHTLLLSHIPEVTAKPTLAGLLWTRDPPRDPLEPG